MTTNSGKGTALVTGASSGIGATYADRLARRGYDLVLVARDENRLTELATGLSQKYGIVAQAFRGDLTERADVRRVEQRLRDNAAITLFVNNAGIGPQGPLLTADLGYLDTMVELNVFAANRLAVAAAQAFVSRGTGAIINTASVVALAPHFFNGTYAASKAFVLSLTEALAGELQGKGVQVQAVLPGLTRTEIFDRAGGSMEALDPGRIMEAGDMVDAALAGLDQGELVTIPSLADATLYGGYIKARDALGPHLSLNRPAPRYGVAV
jgi:short-subunit dehydrogenase